MRLSKRTVPLLGCLGLVCLFIAVTFLMLRQTSSPLNGAQAVVQTTSWSMEIGNFDGFPTNYFPTYYWSGNSDLNYAHKGTDRVTHLYRHQVASANTKDTKGPEVQVNGGYWGPLSPNGKWVIEWGENSLRQRVPTFVAMDGTQRRVGEATWGNTSIWTQSSDAFVSGVWRKTAAIDRYLPGSATRQKIALPKLSSYYEPEHIDASGHMIGIEDGNFIQYFDKASGLPSRNYPTLKFARVDLLHPDSQPEQWTVTVPTEIEHGFCLCSPSGDRLLWIVKGDVTPPMQRILHRYIPMLFAAPQPGRRWLVSGIHGENMHEIASYHDQPQPTPDTGEPFSIPVWMPDSRHISFIHHDTLYTRPTE